MTPPTPRSSLLLGLLVLPAACADPMDEAPTSVYLASPGRFSPPESTLAIGDTQDVEYTGAGRWVGSSGCAGSFKPGSQVFREYMLASWPQISSIGGYNCRPIVGDSSQTSVHGSGRALDLMLRVTSDGDADNDYGDPIARWMIEHAEEIGIQYLIWDRASWRPSREDGKKLLAYGGGGSNPHVDHIHVELSVAAGDKDTPWFAEPSHAAPVQPGCAPLTAEALAAGAVVDDASDCLTMFGPTASWRSVSGEGQGDGYLWTNAYEGPTPGNWARWYLPIEEAGIYDVEVFIPGQNAIYHETRYEVVHGGVATSVVFDQGAGAGWRSLGAFEFAGELTGQHVNVFDNSPTAIPAGQAIAVDAVRLTLTDEARDPGDPDPDDGPDPGDGSALDGGLSGGCAAGGAGAGWPLALVGLALARGRRRRRRDPIAQRR